MPVAKPFFNKLSSRLKSQFSCFRCPFSSSRLVARILSSRTSWIRFFRLSCTMRSRGQSSRSLGFVASPCLTMASADGENCDALGFIMPDMVFAEMMLFANTRCFGFRRPMLTRAGRGRNEAWHPSLICHPNRLLTSNLQEHDIFECGIDARRPSNGLDSVYKIVRPILIRSKSIISSVLSCFRLHMTQTNLILAGHCRFRIT